MADDTGASMAAPASAAATDVSTAASAREGVATGSEYAYVARRKTAEDDTATRDADGQKESSCGRFLLVPHNHFGSNHWFPRSIWAHLAAFEAAESRIAQRHGR